MYFIITIVLVIFFLSMTNYDRKYIYALFLLIPLILTIFNIDNPDKSQYIKAFQIIENGEFTTSSAEFGLRILYFIAVKLHLSAETFLDIFYILTLFLLTRFIFLWSKRHTLVLLLYIVFPFFLDVVQIRTFLSGMIVLNAVLYLKEFSRRNLLKYIFVVCIAGTIHYAALFFLIFALVYLPIKQIIISTLSAVAFMFFIQTKVFSYVLNLLPFLITKINRYRNMAISQLSTNFLIIMYIINFIIAIVYYKYCNNNLSLKDNITHSKIVLKINILSIILLPFSLTSLEFMRLYRVIAIVNYTIVGNILPYNKNNKRFKVISLILMFLIIVSCVSQFYRFIGLEHMDDVVLKVLRENKLWY